MSENDFDKSLEELMERSVGKLIKTESFDASAFDILMHHLWQKAEGLQHEHCISKQVLRSLRSAVAAIRSRAEYLPDVRDQLHWANDFDVMLDRLIAGETSAVRTPGVPRII